MQDSRRSSETAARSLFSVLADTRHANKYHEMLEKLVDAVSRKGGPHFSHRIRIVIARLEIFHRGSDSRLQPRCVRSLAVIAPCQALGKRKSAKKRENGKKNAEEKEEVEIKRVASCRTNYERRAISRLFISAESHAGPSSNDSARRA